jgi:NAD(P)-dependent dehydrogenase (short-subunit alcohol dehydrogenase family)
MNDHQDTPLLGQTSAHPHFPDVFSVKGQLAIVTGGGTGLGFATTSCLVAGGARVVITGRRKEVLDNAVQHLGPMVSAEQHDVTDADSSTSLLERIQQTHGSPTILVNNAGTHVKKTIEDHSVEDFRSILATHVEGAFTMTRATVPYMRRAGKGSIVFIASMSSLIGVPNIVGYSAAKAAYLGMVRSLATELGPANIRVNAIAPGWIETPMLSQALSGDPERKNKILSRTPQKRFGTPAEIGWAIVYLSSPAASFVNGTVLPVDGGASIGF